MKRYFITGIGTGVGKTLVSAVLTEALQADYWKPVQTGSVESTDRDTLRSLVTNPGTVFFDSVYNYREPASPHLAAALENDTIDPQRIKLPASQNHTLIIEGAGGLLVPLNEDTCVIDLARQLDAEVILVCRNYLGCINHSLLSISYLRDKGFKLKGLIMNGNFDEAVAEPIVRNAKVPVLAQFPEIASVNKDTVSQLAVQVRKELFI